MKIFYSAASPFVRKVMVVAHEVGLADRFERLPAAAGPVKRDDAIRAQNPLGQVPTVVTDEGDVLYDSRVICEYLDDLGGGSLFGTGRERWRNLTLAALADGMTGAALLARYEGFLRPEDKRWPDWTGGQLAKVSDAINRFDTAVPAVGTVTIGTISFACGLGYLGLRFPDLDWRSGHPATAAWFDAFGERPSMRETAPQG